MRGLRLGYARNKSGGVWVYSKALGDGRNVPERFARADDMVEADGVKVLSYAQAWAKAIKLAHGDGAASIITKAGTRITVAEARDVYKIDLIKTKGRLANLNQFDSVFRIKKGNKKNGEQDTFHPPWSMAVADLTKEIMEELRDAIVLKGNSAATANRSGKVVKAALNLAARNDARITNRDAWTVGFAPLGAKKGRDRKIHFTREVSGAIIQAAYGDNRGHQLGEKFHTLAEVGTRESQMMKRKRSFVPTLAPTG